MKVTQQETLKLVEQPRRAEALPQVHLHPRTALSNGLRRARELARHFRSSPSDRIKFIRCALRARAGLRGQA